MKHLQKFGKIWGSTFIGLTVLIWIISIITQRDLSIYAFITLFIGVFGASLPLLFSGVKEDRSLGAFLSLIAAVVLLIFYFVLGL